MINTSRMSEHQNKHKLLFHSHTQSVNTPPWLELQDILDWPSSVQSVCSICTSLLVHHLVSLATWLESTSLHLYFILRFILLHSGALYDCHHCQQSVYFYHLPVIHFRYVHLIKFKTLSTLDCLGCCLTPLLDLANSRTLAQEETFPVKCSVLSRTSCIAH